MSVIKLFGPPGCGKTTSLLEEMKKALAQGITPDKIGFFSFTNKAADEAKSRALEKFPTYSEADFYYFRTLHSLALERIGGHRANPCMGWKEWKELGQSLGLELTGSTHNLWDDEMTWDGATKGDKMRSLCDIARLRCQPLMKAWQESENDTLNYFEVERFQTYLSHYKKRNGYIDFVDMLEKACDSPDTLPHFEYLFIDEAQDLSSLQWRLVELLKERAKVTFVAGDDDQAIFRWAGADIEKFIEFEGNKVVLPQSYRVPKSVHKLAGELRKGIRNSVPKEWLPREEEGRVVYHHSLIAENIGLDKGQWLLLCRNNYQAKELVRICVDNGYTFSCKGSFIKTDSLKAVRIWETLRSGQAVKTSEALFAYDFLSVDIGYKRGSKEALRKASGVIDITGLKERYGLLVDAIWHESLTKISKIERDYYIRARQRGEKLLQEPRIRISTIHGAKGGEADNVLLVTDMSYKTAEAFERNQDDEYRVWYVAITRVKKELHILLPLTKSYFNPLTWS